ncbi:hypothetical protein ACWGJ0_27490 [Streptomyces massasporeus]
MVDLGVGEFPGGAEEAVSGVGDDHVDPAAKAPFTTLRTGVVWVTSRTGAVNV